MADSRAPGLRVQIVLALAGLMLLAFVPLFFALAAVTRATLRDAHEEAARAIGRSVAAHLGEVRRRGDHAMLVRALESHVGQGGVEAIDVFDASGALEASAGEPAEIAAMHAPTAPYGEAEIRVRGARGRALDVIVPVDDGAVLARLRTDDDADRAAPLVRLVALYMILFALALVTFAYFALTRLIVRPIDALVAAADRVASGARALAVPRAGARELVELGASVQAMTTRLVSDETAMRSKVEELTRATRRLGETQTQLVRSEQMASVGRLAAGIAHEVGNPIAAILGMEDLLLDGDLPEAEQRDFVARMKKETERINVIIRDLLDFARPEAVQATGTVEPAHVASVVDDVLALLKPQKTFKGITARREITNEDLRVAVSAPRLTQVLLNVTMNALAAITSRDKAMPAPVDGDALTVRVTKVGERMRIEVDDTGPGVPAEMRERIFEPFVTTKDVGEGTGLGLAVCRGVVSAAGGTIRVDPAFGPPGARFVIEIPLAHESAPIPTSKPPVVG